ncbi:hypothetical protein CN135_08110 [Sinorhizobium meliloti]|nr:hypothetical protein CN135_08110 [Sinorhizobium meliloti]
MLCKRSSIVFSRLRICRKLPNFLRSFFRNATETAYDLRDKLIGIYKCCAEPVVVRRSGADGPP